MAGNSALNLAIQLTLDAEKMKRGLEGGGSGTSFHQTICISVI
jgi:hypothetical protein